MWQVTNQGKCIRKTEDLSTETLEAGRAWSDISQALKNKKCQPKLLYTTKLYFKIEGGKKPSMINKT